MKSTFLILTRHIAFGALAIFLIFWSMGELPYFSIINNRFWLWLALISTVTVTTWLCSKPIGRMTFIEGKKPYMISFAFILFMWTMLFFVTAIFDGVYGSIKSGQFEIIDYLEGYVIYRLWVYIALGVIHALIGGIFLSHDLKRISKRLTEKRHITTASMQ
jgi:hypothetical protein